MHLRNLANSTVTHEPKNQQLVYVSLVPKPSQPFNVILCRKTVCNIEKLGWSVDEVRLLYHTERWLL